jgi:hypothetical protein
MLVCVPPASGAAPEQVAPAAPFVAAASVAPTPLFAFLGLEKYTLGLTNRTNIVRFCTCVMALALFIMLKK